MKNNGLEGPLITQKDPPNIWVGPNEIVGGWVGGWVAFLWKLALSVE